MITWDGERFTVGGTTFRAMPETMLSEGADLGMQEGEFFLFKSRSLVERHAALVNELKPKEIFELGFFGGGGALLYAEIARPRRVVTIDRLELKQNREHLEEHAAKQGLGDVVRVFGGVDQADRHRLKEIAEEAFDGSALDLVVDDCSHLYEATRASFNELFPRLRPGGIYVIEDWRWAHNRLGEEPLEGWQPEQVPLTRLLFEIVLAIPSVPDLVTEISIEPELALIKRGKTEVDPASFDISACSNPRGQALLAPT